jgi:hypothetical protein
MHTVQKYAANVASSSQIFVTLIMQALYVSPKRRSLQEQHDVTSQRTAFFVRNLLINVYTLLKLNKRAKQKDGNNP